MAFMSFATIAVSPSSGAARSLAINASCASVACATQTVLRTQAA